MTNFEKITRSINALADYMVVNHMCDDCPAEFGVCREFSENGTRHVCRLNWREWLKQKATDGAKPDGNER